MKTKILKLTLLLIGTVLISLSGCNNSIDSNIEYYASINPNPLKDYGTVEYNLLIESTVSLTITDNFGREIMKVINNENQEAKLHNKVVDLRNVPVGFYSLIFKFNEKIIIRKFEIIR